MTSEAHQPGLSPRNSLPSEEVLTVGPIVAKEGTIPSFSHNHDSRAVEHLSYGETEYLSLCTLNFF